MLNAILRVRRASIMKGKCCKGFSSDR